MPDVLKPSSVHSYSSQLLQQLSSNRDRGFLVDVSIVADGNVRFPAHKIVLASVSEFFAELFRSSNSGSSQEITRVHLVNCDSKSVGVALRFIYSGCIDVQDCDIVKLHSIAKACKLNDLRRLLESKYQSIVSGEEKLNSKLAANDSLKTQDASTSASIAGHVSLVQHSIATSSPMTLTPASKTSSASHSKQNNSCLKELVKHLCPAHSIFGCHCSFSTNSSPESLPRAVMITSSHLTSLAENNEHKFALKNENTTTGNSFAVPVSNCSPVLNVAATSSLNTSSLPANSYHPIVRQSRGVTASLPTSSNSLKRCLEENGVKRVRPKIHDEGRACSSSSPSVCRSKPYIRITSDGSFQCTFCKKEYDSYSTTSTHVSTYHRQKTVCCDAVGCSFSTRCMNYIHFHKYNCHSTPLPPSIASDSHKCPFCKHVTHSRVQLKKHLLRKHRTLNHSGYCCGQNDDGANFKRPASSGYATRTTYSCGERVIPEQSTTDLSCSISDIQYAGETTRENKQRYGVPDHSTPLPVVATSSLDRIEKMTASRPRPPPRAPPPSCCSVSSFSGCDTGSQMTGLASEHNSGHSGLLQADTTGYQSGTVANSMAHSGRHNGSLSFSEAFLEDNIAVSESSLIIDYGTV